MFFSGSRNWSDEQRKAMLESMPVTMPVEFAPYDPAAFETEAGRKTLESQWCESIRSIFEADGHLEMTAFVFGTRCVKTREKKNMTYATQIKSGPYNDYNKDAFSQVLRLTCSYSEARAIVTISEAWINTAYGDPSVQEWRDSHNGSLKGHPATFEAAWVIMESSDADPVMFVARIHEVDGKRVLGSWERQSGVALEGRFAGLLRTPDKEAN